MVKSRAKGKQEEAIQGQQQQGQQEGESGLLGMQKTGPQEETLYHMKAQAWFEQPKCQDKGQLCGYDQCSNQHCPK